MKKILSFALALRSLSYPDFVKKKCFVFESFVNLYIQNILNIKKQIKKFQKTVDFLKDL